MQKFLCFAATVALACLPSTAATLLNENFDELTPTLSATSVGAFSTINGTNVDIVGGALFGSLCVSPESGNCVDMDGTGGNPQGVLQTNTPITLTPGVDYFLSFDLIGSQRGLTTSTTVTFGPYSQTFSLASGDDTSGIVTNQLVTVSSLTMANLTFTSNTPGDIGALLDNVLVTSGSVSTVPEPGTWRALSLLAGAGLLRRWLRAAGSR